MCCKLSAAATNSITFIHSCLRLFTVHLYQRSFVMVMGFSDENILQRGYTAEKSLSTTVLGQAHTRWIYPLYSVLQLGQHYLLLAEEKDAELNNGIAVDWLIKAAKQGRKGAARALQRCWIQKKGYCPTVQQSTCLFVYSGLWFINCSFSVLLS